MITQDFMRNARKKTGLTQEDFAKKVGTTRQNIKNYENGLCRAPGDIVLKTIEMLKKYKRKKTV